MREQVWLALRDKIDAALDAYEHWRDQSTTSAEEHDTLTVTSEPRGPSAPMADSSVTEES